jgi:hypothetical protein
MTEPHPAGDHLQADEVADYLAGTLSGRLRERITRHLADCEECTAELVAVNRLRRPSRAPVRWVAAAAAAAVGAVLLLGPGLMRRPSADEPLVRGTESSIVVRAVQPLEGAELHGRATFAWHGVPRATAYRVSVSRPDGDSVWATTTRDTTINASEDLLRAGPGSYYWYVDALLEDGHSVTGPAHEFRLGP